MEKIKLKRANVVKEVDSEDRAKALEAKGFVRTDGKTAPESGTDVDKVVSELKKRLTEASKVMEKADEVKGKLEKELAETKEKLQTAEGKAEEAEKELESVKAQLQEAEKKVQTLETELEGTKEQLEAAVKQNKAAGKK